MCIIRAVRQTKLPVLVGLVYHGPDHLVKEVERRIVERHQDTDFDHLVKLGTALFVCLFRRGKACCSVQFFRLRLDFFLF